MFYFFTVVENRKSKAFSIHSVPHDSKSILPSINQINNNNENRNIKYNVAGDKGFIIDTKDIPSNVNLITIKRRNQHIQNTSEEKLILKKRYSPSGHICSRREL